MNAHRRKEAKRARRAKRIAQSRSGTKGPVARACVRAAAMNEGERRILQMGRHVGEYLSERGIRTRRKPTEAATPLVETFYGTLTRPDLVDRLERRFIDEHREDVAA